MLWSILILQFKLVWKILEVFGYEMMIHLEDLDLFWEDFWIDFLVNYHMMKISLYLTHSELYTKWKSSIDVK